MQRNADNGTTTWSVDENKLNQQLGNDETSIAATANNGSKDAVGGVSQPDAINSVQRQKSQKYLMKRRHFLQNQRYCPTTIQMNNTALL